MKPQVLLSVVHFRWFLICWEPQDFGAYSYNFRDISIAAKEVSSVLQQKKVCFNLVVQCCLRNWLFDLCKCILTFLEQALIWLETKNGLLLNYLILRLSPPLFLSQCVRFLEVLVPALYSSQGHCVLGIWIFLPSISSTWDLCQFQWHFDVTDPMSSLHTQMRKWTGMLANLTCTLKYVPGMVPLYNCPWQSFMK